MEKLTRAVLEEIMQEDWIWTKPTRENPKPELRYDAVRSAVDNIKEAKYYDEILFPVYHRFVKKLKAVKSKEDEGWHEVHFEIVDGEWFFGADCFHCQMKVDARIDKILTQYVEEHPEWRQEYIEDKEIDECVTKKPAYQETLF